MRDTYNATLGIIVGTLGGAAVWALAFAVLLAVR